MKRTLLVLLTLTVVLSGSLMAADKEVEETEKKEENPLASAVAGFTLREIGPAFTSGRITELVVHPDHKATWYVATASGGVWKTHNAGTIWTPIFDGEGSYSIGTITLDPNDPKVIWVGTGENNSQRSVSYGDGVYRSNDGGRTWSNMGLEESEHIGRIVVDPRDSKVVYVAAQGPLWSAGGDRGLYKTVDGGESWEKVLEISEHTGVNEVWMDPRDPDVLYASSYQRRRRTWTLINGGPESAIYKSTDAGANWSKLESGLPSEDKGKIGLAVSPVDPDVLYAIVESIGDKGGTYRSTDAGANWERRSDYVSGSPQYYNELIPDPVNVDRVYSMDTWLHVTNDGGATWTQVPENSKHVDNHSHWIDPDDTNHMISGNDGGIYETWDAGANWQFKANLPLAQFYKIAVDNDLPFYNVYGGTQDNSTLGGPSRTTSEHGITNADWFVAKGGDGFKPAVDPTNPDIVYAQSQYANLVRYDRKSGEKVDIQPQPEPGEDPPRWNWDAALLISPHSPTRLYFTSQRVYRSDDRGDTWEPISPDLTRNIDRNQLEVMGKVWSVDTVAKNVSTSAFGNIVSITESPLVEGLLYAGTDDGLIQVTEDGGQNWRQIDSFPGVPDMAYISDLEASLHDADTVFATIDNHKSGDFKPYVLKSTNRGGSWTSIANNLPDKGTAYTIVQDFEKADLLFVGTEFGVFVSLDGGNEWHQLEGGIPTIAVRDLVIQQREVDLVIGTFGRGIFILDDYTPLRYLDDAAIAAEATLFPSRDTWMFMKSYELGYNRKAFMGDDFYSAPNPPYGAVLTYHLRDGLETLADKRRKAEKETEEGGSAVSYPTWEELRAEDRAEDPMVVLTIKDSAGNLVRRLTGPTSKGINRVAWDLRYPPADPISLQPPPSHAFSDDPMGPLTIPGTYSATLSKWENNQLTELSGPISFETRLTGTATLPASDRAAVLAFQQEANRLMRAVAGTSRVMGEVQARIDHLHLAALATPGGDPTWPSQLENLETRLNDLQDLLTGDSTVARRSEPISPSIRNRVGRALGYSLTTTSAPTTTQRRQIEIASQEFGPVLDGLRSLVSDLESLESDMEAAGAPWTPGRIPDWQPNQ